ncbi:MAG: extracellular solute-binding protein [Alphaproteobacteria bacterium]|nr:extracellular solute-binding protein [Alphaproteobacteria bacterium]
MTRLLGLTWDHPRATDGLYAATAAFRRANPGIDVRWETHPLRGFESTPIEELAARYDLIVLDHPFMGDVASSGCLLDLSADGARLGLDDLRADTVGRSFATYAYGGHWAVPIDAACQIAVYRADRIAALGAVPPRRWREVEALAARGRVAVALKNVHALMTFFTMCSNLGAVPSSRRGLPLVDHAAGQVALARLRALHAWCPDALSWNAIDLHEAMAAPGDLVYCPYVYGYVPYARPAGGRAALAFADIPSADDSGSCRGSTIGGTGLAISRRCAAPDAALRLAAFLVRPDTQLQTGLDGGQPARRSAWRDDRLNAASGDFFRATLATMEAAAIRPRYRGYMTLQNEGGEIVGQHLRGEAAAADVLASLDRLHHHLLAQAEPVHG